MTRSHALFVLTFGAATGAVWCAALLPVGAIGPIGYDATKYAFAISVLLILASLMSPRRTFGNLLGLVLGLVLGATLWACFAPAWAQLRGRSFFSAVLLGLPLSIGALIGVSITWASRESRCRESADEMRTHSIASVPRRFGLPSMMVVVFVTSALLAVSTWMRFPPVLTLYTFGLLAIISAMQMLSTGIPRVVSVGAGAVMLPLTLGIGWLFSGPITHPLFASLLATPADVTFVAAHLVVVGAVSGYVGGVVVAGVFLLIDLTGFDQDSDRALSE